MPSSEKPLTLRERNKLLRRQAILDAARELLLEVGYDAVSIEGIAARADLTKPTVYAYFESREEILLAAYLQVFDHMEAILSAAAALTTPKAKLSHFVREVLTANFASRLPLYSWPPQDILSHPTVIERRDFIRQSVVAILQEGQAKGEFASDLEPVVAVQFVLSVKGNRSLEGFVHHGEIPADEMVEHLHGCVLDAICIP
jgi:AcrR family transcriptional regulator